MRLFQVFLAGFLIALAGYTLKTISTDGLNLLAVFFGDIAKMGWPGQFNLDFLGFLMLSAVWTAWRNKFSPVGFTLAICAFFLGMAFLTVYLLYLTIKHSGDMEAVLLGLQASPQRAA